MIEIYKIIPIQVEDEKYLESLNPFWKKRLNKLIKKNLKWISRFTKNYNDFLYVTDVENISVKKLIDNVNNLFSFYSPKFKKIATERTTLRKLNKMITDFIKLVGLCHSLTLVIDFFKNLEKIEEQSKYLISNTNSLLKDKWKRYSSEVISHTPKIKNNEIKNLINVAFFSDTEIFNNKEFVNLIVKCHRDLYLNEFEKESTFLRIVYFSYLESGFNDEIRATIYKILKDIHK